MLLMLHFVPPLCHQWVNDQPSGLESLDALKWGKTHLLLNHHVAC
jgi:hypothetical protein